jgi:hypothetical protein
MTGDLPVIYEQMRTLVLESLSGADQVGGLCRTVAGLAAKRGITSNQNEMSRQDRGRVRSILWDLIIEGIVRPGCLNDATNDKWPFYHVTEFGTHVLSGQPPSAYDPDGYLKRMKADIPNVDDVIVTYLSESLHTLRISCLLSSTVTLGCASEQALLLLIEAYASKLPSGTMRDKFVKATEGKMVKAQYDEFSKMLEGHLRGKLPKHLREEIDTALNGIFPMLRDLRNKTGHPTGFTVSREVAYANLMIFPTMLKRLYGIIDWLATASL